MTKPQFSALLAFLTFAAASGVKAGPAGALLQGNKERVGALIAEADRLPLDKAWSVLERIGDLELSEDSKLKALQTAAEGAGPVGRLVAARGLLDLNDFYAQKAVELIAPVLEGSAELAHRLAAAELLGNEDFDGRAVKRARAALETVVKNDTEDAILRLVAAKALYQVATSQQALLARKTLMGYLKSRDRHLRIQGALAMYEIGDHFRSGARAILEDVENEPTPEGRLARAYLDQERGAKNVERLQRQLSRLMLEDRGVESGRSTKADDLGLLREILKLVEAAHIDGKTVDKKFLIERAARGMLKALDPFSSFLTSEQYSRFAFDLTRHYGGIGAFVRIDDNGVFQITRPIYSGPAYKAGLLSGDRILEVDGWETHDKELDEIIRRLKGKPNTDVRIKVWRPGWPEPQDITLSRQEIQVPSVNDLMLPGKIGYVELITFASDTSEELRYKLEELKRRGARALIVDLRSNSGGYLHQARAVAELFLPKGKLIVSTKSRIEKKEEFFARSGAVFPELPVVVLVDGTTASASEIVSGALQDHKRATVVGEQTYGKGSVQNLYRLSSDRGEPYTDENQNGRKDPWEDFDDKNNNGRYDPGPRARITIARYYLPLGRCLHKIVDKDGKVLNPDYGVIPDYEIQQKRLDTKELWKNAVIAELWRNNTFQAYVKKHFEANKDLFLELALSDKGVTGAYPEFDSFYESLNTKLTKDDIRKWVRAVVREKVADLRAKAWPGIRFMGDYQEDVQLQAAVKVALDKLGEQIGDYSEYKGVLKLPGDFGKRKAKSERKG